MVEGAALRRGPNKLAIDVEERRRQNFNAAAPDVFAASMAAGISSGLAIWCIESSTLRKCAASFSA